MKYGIDIPRNVKKKENTIAKMEMIYGHKRLQKKGEMLGWHLMS